MKKKVYTSKFGWGVFLFMAVVFWIVFWLSTTEANTSVGTLSMLFVFGAILVLFSIMSLKTKYTIANKDLIIRCLPFYNKSIAINRIKKVEVSRNIMSSPAPSLDRIEIHFDKFDSVVISPKNKLQFMDHLKQINPSIELIKTY